MKAYQAFNTSLSTFLFSFNNHYSFFKNQGVMTAYRSVQLFDLKANTAADFEILTQNCLLAALQIHVTILNESVKFYCNQTKRNKFQNDALFDFIKKFSGVFKKKVRHAQILTNQKF